MTDSNFKADLPVGKSAEHEVESLFIKHGYTILEHNDYRYDLRVSKGNKEYTVEVKHDLTASRTGNVGVEYESRGRLSGISTSIADFYIYKIKNKLYCIKTAKLRQMIEDSLYFMTNVNGGDRGSNTMMHLFKEKVFTSNCKLL